MQPVADLQARDGTHEWVSFEDPGEERTWVFDVTFMLSHWGCIFGRGCQGVLTEPAAALVHGCCSYGPHFGHPSDRRHWGAGGDEFAWWCTESPEAFTEAEPVYKTLRDELVALTSQQAYDMLSRYLDKHTNGSPRPLPHPAERPVTFVRKKK